MAFWKLVAEVVLSLSVVGAWCYVALTLPVPANAASAQVAKPLTTPVSG